MTTPPCNTTPGAEPVLSVHDLVKSYGSRKALAGVTFAISAGERVVLLGPNGAGKSTLMQLLTGLYVPDTGRVEVLGHDMRRSAAPALAGLGVVFQQMALDLDLSVTANLLFHTDLHGLPRPLAQQRITQGLAMLGLQDCSSQPVRALSGGNRRKVELARALLHRPALLLMDEATVGLDFSSRRQLMQTVAQLCHGQRLATLWATHLVDEATDADRVLVLHQGQLLFDGTVTDCLERTQTPDLESAFMRLTGQATGSSRTG